MDNKTEPRSQSKSIGLVAIVNAISAVAGIAQAFIVGRLFGTTVSIEVFFAASAIFASVSKLLQAGQITEIFTPIYHQIKESHGADAAFGLQAVLLNWMLLITVFVISLLFFAASFFIPLTVPGFSEDRVATCVLMFHWLAPLIALQIIQFLLASLLISEKCFVAREVVSAIAILVGLLIIIFLASRFGAWVMIGALWATAIFRVVGFSVLIFRMGYRHHFRLHHNCFRISDVFKKLPTIFGYVCVAQLFAMVLTAGLSTLPQGYLAVYHYSGRLYSKLSGILVRPVSTVFFSHFSSAVAERDASVQRKSITGALRLILLMTTATCVLAITTGLPTLRALWLSSVFPESRIWLTYVTFCSLCVLPVFAGLGLIFRKINMAHQFTHSQYFILIASQIVNILLAYFLIPAWGLVGAVSALLLYSILTATASGILLYSTRPESLALYDRKTIYQCCILFGITTFPLLLFQHGTNFYQWFPSATLGHFAAAVVLGSLAVALMALIAHWLGIAELRSGLNLLQLKFKRLTGAR